MAFEDELKSQARALGFALTGIARAGPADDFARLQDWLKRGYAGSMSYMERHGDARRDPSSILPEVRSVMMVGMEYGEVGSGQWSVASEERATGADALKNIGASQAPLLPTDHCPLTTAQVARYARGSDYHGVLRAKLRALFSWLRERRPETHGRAVVDTAPLLERDFARRAGLGWIGKNTMLINKHRGSYFFLGALLVDIELAADAPHDGFHCGTCTACLDACPTDAFAAPGWLDARKCISYLTIEHRGPMPEELRAGVGDWLFGCDICQEVCPWNRKDDSRPEAVDPVELLRLTDAEFRRRFGGSALERTRRRGLVRNAAIVLGNLGDERALPALRESLTDDDEIVREAAAWAIGRIQDRHPA
jgi:epoxyqueuosine reductase